MTSTSKASSPQGLDKGSAGISQYPDATHGTAIYMPIKPDPRWHHPWPDRQSGLAVPWSVWDMYSDCSVVGMFLCFFPTHDLFGTGFTYIGGG